MGWWEKRERKLEQAKMALTFQTIVLCCEVNSESYKANQWFDLASHMLTYDGT